MWLYRCMNASIRDGEFFERGEGVLVAVLVSEN